MSDAASVTTSVTTSGDRRWAILGVIGLAQVMVIMSLTVMNIALISAQRALHFSTVDRQWVVTAYTLAFGSLLLLGGRLAGLVVATNVSTIVLMPRAGPKPLVASGMLTAAGAAAWLAQLGPHTGYAAGVLGPLILAGIGLGMVIAPAINTGTFGVAPQDAGEASATVTVGQQLGASIGTSLLSTIFAAAVTSYIATHLALARIIGRQALAGLALAHGYDTAFWWTAGILAGGAVVGGALLRRGPLVQKRTPSPADGRVTTARTGPSGERAQ
jgi:MFS family permease